MAWETLSDLENDIRDAMTKRDPARLRELQPQIRAFDEPLAPALDLFVTGLAAEFTGDLDVAFSTYNAALEAFQDLHEPQWVAQIHTNIGSVFYFRSDFANAMGEFRRAIDLLNEDDPVVAANLNNLGAVYYNVGDFPNALEYFERAYQSHRGRSAPIAASGSLMNMGNVYSSMQDRDQALEMYQRALTLQEEHGSERDVFMTICNIALNHIHSGRLEEAEAALNRAERIALTEDNAPMLERVYSQRIELLRVAQRYDEAELFIDEHDFLETPTVPFRINALRDLGLIWRERGDLGRAIHLLEQALELSEHHGLRSFAEGLHAELMELAKRSGDLDSYIQHNDHYTQIREELRGNEASVKIAMYAQERELEAEREEALKHRALLYSTLPASVADRMLRGEDVSGDHHDHVSVLFLDIVGFTTHSSALSPQETTALLAQIFDRFDDICRQYDVTKIKTIGDSYMAVSFANAQGAQSTEQRAASVARAMLDSEFYWPTATGSSYSNRIQFRIGLHCGPVVAGVIGTQRLQYDVWGDTVNTASRMESTSEAGRIQASSEFHEQLSNHVSPLTLERGASEGDGLRFWTTLRGNFEVKGKGTMTTYWLEGA